MQSFTTGTKSNPLPQTTKPQHNIISIKVKKIPSNIKDDNQQYNNNKDKVQPIPSSANFTRLNEDQIRPTISISVKTQPTTQSRITQKRTSIVHIDINKINQDQMQDKQRGKSLNNGSRVKVQQTKSNERYSPQTRLPSNRLDGRMTSQSDKNSVNIHNAIDYYPHSACSDSITIESVDIEDCQSVVTVNEPRLSSVS